MKSIQCLFIVISLLITTPVFADVEDAHRKKLLQTIEMYDLNRIFDWLRPMGEPAIKSGMALYSIHVTLINRAFAEKAFCKYEIERKRPCPFDILDKSADFYINKFDVEINDFINGGALNLENVEKAARRSLCKDGRFFVASNADGSPFCSLYYNKQGAEQGRLACGESIWQWTELLNREVRVRKVAAGWQIFRWWDDYTYASQFANGVCPNGSVWGDNVICNRFNSYLEAASHHKACGEHLESLQHHYWVLVTFY